MNILSWFMRCIGLLFLVMWVGTFWSTDWGERQSLYASWMATFAVSEILASKAS